MRENIFLWKREEHLKDANKASNNFGPPQSEDPAALEDVFGEGREGRTAFLLRVDPSRKQLMRFKTKMYQLGIRKAF